MIFFCKVHAKITNIRQNPQYFAYIQKKTRVYSKKFCFFLDTIFLLCYYKYNKYFGGSYVS